MVPFGLGSTHQTIFCDIFGDVPVLDRTSILLSRWIGKAGFSLVCALIILVGFAREEGHAREVNQLSWLNGVPNRNVEHTVNMIRDVRGLIADYSVTHANEHCEADLPFSGRARAYSVFDFFNAVCPSFPLDQGILGKEKMPQLDMGCAQLGLEPFFRVQECLDVVFYEIAFKPDLYARGGRLAEIFNRHANTENNAIFREFCWMFEFNVFEGKPRPSTGNRILPIEFVGGLSDSNRSFHVAGLLLSGTPKSPRGPKQAASKYYEKTVEKNEQPFGGMLTETFVPKAFLLSFIIVFVGSFLNRYFALLAIPVFGFGWLFLIIWGGLM